jgi:PAS domain S-box-containing protein
MHKSCGIPMTKQIISESIEEKSKEVSTTLMNSLQIPETNRGEERETYGVEQRMCLSVNKEGRITSVNEFCADQLGYRLKELTGKTIDKIIFRNDRNRIKGFLADYISKLSPGLIYDFLMVDKKGNTFLAKWAFYTMQNAAFGKVLFMVSERGSDARRSGSVIQLFDGLNNRYKKAREVTLIVLTPSAILVEGMQKILESEIDIHIIARVSDVSELKPFINSGIPDVLIVDTITPNLNVNELIISIKEKDVQTQVLLLLHTPDHQLVIDSLNLGVKGFITKKSKSSKLIQAIRILRRGEMYGDVKVMKRIIGEFLNSQNDTNAVHYNTLTKKEIAIAKLVMDGCSNKIIAKELFITEKTVKTHLNRIYKKLKVTGRYELAARLK